MKVSVVIPAYNASSTIAAAIESCLNQTKKPYEVIVVDDASTDNTIAIAEKHPEVKVLRQKSNKGPSAARNLGWDTASGDIVAFLDSDDTWHTKKLEVIAEIFTDYGHIQYLGHPYTTNEFPQSNSLKVTHQTYLSTLIKNPYQPSCIAVRTDIQDRFDETYRYCEDYELSLRIAHKYSTHWLDATLTRLGRPQLSKGGASANIWKMRKGELRLYTSVYRHSIIYLLFVPFLWIFSLCKMAYRLTQR